MMSWFYMLVILYTTNLLRDRAVIVYYWSNRIELFSIKILIFKKNAVLYGKQYGLKNVM